MRCLALLSLLSGLCAAVPASAASMPPRPDKDGKYTLSAPGIRVQFVPFAASIANLFVKDKHGVERDIVPGYDNAASYPNDPNHSDLNAVVGRYTNRISNGTFSLDGVTYHTPRNNDNNTLHSGPNGWSYRFFNVSRVDARSIAFTIDDPAMSTGMPGRVRARITYTVSARALHIAMDAVSPDARSPLMLTQHTYWNLDGFADPATDRIWKHTLHTPFSRRMLEPDGNMLPTGNIVPIPSGDINDFWSAPKPLGAHMASDARWRGNCGTASGCAGYNNLWIVDRPAAYRLPVVSLRSPWSGIAVDYHTNQAGVQIYSCSWMNGAIKLKRTQGVAGRPGALNSGSCIALEAQDWSDGINHPEWGRIPHQVFGPGDKYRWEATYRFSSNN